MTEQYHILNGDALKEQFPQQISGEVIVTRECLIEGPVDGDSLEEFFEIRSSFIQNAYGDFEDEDYNQKSVSEFSKMMNIPAGSEINLWFEDDLFCQVNLWFVCSLLKHALEDLSVFLVRPEIHTPYGFGGLSEEELVAAFENRMLLSENLSEIAELWNYYRHGNTDLLRKAGKGLENDLPFLLPAIEAHIDRIPTENDPGRPVRSLIQIKKELDTDEFGPVFREFNKRESIYGFGDLQVKRLFDDLHGVE